MTFIIRLFIFIGLCCHHHQVLAAVTVSASAEQLHNRAENTLDGDLSGPSRWSADGYGQWIAYDMSTPVTVTSVAIAFYRGAERLAYFDIQTSSDNRFWKTVLFGARSNGVSKGLQTFDLPDTTTRFIRIVGKGNSNNRWNSYTEVVWATANTSASWWRPAKGATWQWQLSGSVNTGYNVDIYDVDLEDTATGQITELKQSGKKVICYFSAGSYENWRTDSDLFHNSDLGKTLDGWPGERWLNISSDNVRAIMRKRMELASEKGCDAVEPDNIDGYTNANGLSLTYDQQLNYNRFLAETAHSLGLAIALKNNLDQVDDLAGLFDFAVNEECHYYQECEMLQPFLLRNKPVLNVEYDSAYIEDKVLRAQMCDNARKLGIHALIMPLELDDSFRLDCGKPWTR